MNEPLLIVGGSARAAAESARRAGFIPWVVDAFGDDDTRRLAECRVDPRYPTNLVAEAQQFPPADWMYVGGLENLPSIVERLTTERPLLGIGGRSLSRVRDPWTLRAVPGVEGVRFPEIYPDASGLARDGTWLWKSRRSAGGLGVGNLGGKTSPQMDGGRYFERRISGICCGVTFLGDGQNARFVGAVRQRIDDGDRRHPFLYGGAIGPIPLAEVVRSRLEDLGRNLAAEFGLVGLFGVDVILEGDVVWVLEVNPRYTASVELLEHAYDVALVADHVRACRDRALPPPRTWAARRTVGKRIVYAGDAGATVAPEFTELLWKLRGDDRLPAVADIPPAASTVGPHAPLATVLSAGNDSTAVAEQLQAAAAEIGRAFDRLCVAR